MLAEAIFAGGQIAWLVVLGAIGLFAIFILVMAIVGIFKEMKEGSDYTDPPPGPMLVIGGAFLLFAISVMITVIHNRADAVAITKDLGDQGFCIDSISTGHKTATICQDNGSTYEVKVERRDDSWIAVSGSQKLLAGPTTTTQPPVTPPPLRPEDLTSAPTTSQPLR